MFFALLLTAAAAAQAPPPATTHATSSAPTTAAPATGAGQIAGDGGSTVAAARAAAGRGDLAGALAAYQAVAAADPTDLEARLGVADVLARMRHYDRAETVYGSVLLDDPTSLRAAVGLAQALEARHDFAAALDLLRDAETRAPQNAAVLAALGRVQAAAGHQARAIPYLERAASIAPTASNVGLLDRTRAGYDHRLAVSGVDEQFGSVRQDTRGADVLLDLRLSETLRVSGRGQWERKFGVDDARGGAGLEWRWASGTALLGHAVVGSGNRVMANGEGYVAIERRRGPVSGRVGVRVLDFAGARVVAVEPSGTWCLDDRTAMELRYAHTSTSLGEGWLDEGRHHVVIRGTRTIFPRVSATLGYAHGIEIFDALSIDRLAGFRANTASAGLRVDWPTRTSVIGAYDYQWRADLRNMQRITLTLSQRF